MPWQAQTYSIYENFSFLFFFWEGGWRVVINIWKYKGVFGWGENRNDEKYGEKKQGEKCCFPLFGWKMKIGETENKRKSFLPQAHFFNPPKSGGKCGEKNVVKALLHKYPHLPLIHDLMTFSSHPYHFCLFSSLPSQHTNIQVLFSLSLSLFFFFFNMT